MIPKIRGAQLTLSRPTAKKSTCLALTSADAGMPFALRCDRSRCADVNAGYSCHAGRPPVSVGASVPNTTVRAVLADLARHPSRLLHQWNWKSAVVSALLRSSIFFTVNLPSGRDAATAAFVTEVCFRLATSGFYGGITSAFRLVEPEWKGMLAAMLVLPVVSHSLELLVHTLRGTPELAASILASVAFTVLSTSFNVFAMRRGALITGAGSEPLHRDLMRMPALCVAFVRLPLGALERAVRACRPVRTQTGRGVRLQPDPGMVRLKADARYPTVRREAEATYPVRLKADTTSPAA